MPAGMEGMQTGPSATALPNRQGGGRWRGEWDSTFTLQRSKFATLKPQNLEMWDGAEILCGVAVIRVKGLWEHF
jgi:hypothetical protein